MWECTLERQAANVDEMPLQAALRVAGMPKASPTKD
jgi:hypothetical protein